MSDTITFASDASKRSVKNWAARLVLLIIGLFIAHFGVVLFVLAEMGTDTFTIFVQGVSNVAGLSIGTCQVIILTVMMVLMALFTKGYVKPGTLICAFCGGWQIDLYMWLLDGKLSAVADGNTDWGHGSRCVIIALGKSSGDHDRCGKRPQ